jgi:hypothetical protein
LVPTDLMHKRAVWPELTNWPSGTHKGTKLEQPGSAFEAEQAVTPFLSTIGKTGGG